MVSCGSKHSDIYNYEKVGKMHIKNTPPELNINCPFNRRKERTKKDDP